MGIGFPPLQHQLYDRIRAIENQKLYEENNFYCSAKCKGECNIYRHRIKNIIDKKLYSSYELKIWREEVLKRQRKEYGYNFCEYCEKEKDIYHVHHVIPKKQEQMYSLDPDNGIICCQECHYKNGHSGECAAKRIGSSC